MTRRPDPSLIVLAVAIVAAVIANLIPFRFDGHLEHGVAELIAGFSLHSEDSISISLFQRLAVYLPLGILIYWILRRRGASSPTTGTVAAIAFMGFVVEILQGFVSLRQTFVIDYLLVVVIGGLAAALAEIVTDFSDHRRRAFGRLLILGNTLAFAALILAQGGADLESWDCSYPLVIGNEASGDRPWLGSVRGIALYPKALANDDIRTLSPGFAAPDAETARHDLGAGRLYLFDQRSEPAGAFRGNTPLKLEDGALHIQEPSRIEAIQDIEGLCEAVKAVDAFTIEVEFATDDIDQRGPARIVTMSLDPERRNVTLAQARERLSLRIRNAINGTNGIQQQILTPERIVAGQWQHWIARYDRGVTALFLNGEVVAPTLDYEAILMIGGHSAVHLALIAGLLTFVLAIAAHGWLSVLKHAPGLRLIAAGAVALTPQLILLLLIDIVSHRPTELSVLLSIIATAGLGVMVGWVLKRSWIWA